MDSNKLLPQNIILTLAAAVAYALTCVLIKLTPAIISNSVIIFCLACANLITLLPWLIIDKEFSFAVKQPWLMLVAAITLLLAIACLVFELKYIPLTHALVLANSFPLFLPLANYILFPKAGKRIIWLPLIIGGIGIVIVLANDHKNFHITTLLALTAGIFTAISMATTQQITTKGNELQFLFYFLVIAIILSGVFIPFNWRGSNPSTWLLLMGIGIASALYQYIILLTYRLNSKSSLSFLVLFTIILSLIADWLWWQYIPSFLSLIGIVLVVCATVLPRLWGNQT